MFDSQANPEETTPTLDQLTMVPLERLEADIQTFAAHLAAATAVWLCQVAEYDRRRGWEQWECRSMAHWLNWKCGVSLRTAREQVRVAAALDEFPRIRAGFLEGSLSYSKVRAVTRVATPFNEPDLVALCHSMTASQLDRCVAAFRVDKSAEDEDHAAAVAFADRRVVKRPNYDGSTTTSFTLPDDLSEVSYAAIEHAASKIIEQHRAEGESRRLVVDRLGGTAAIRADAVVALLCGTLDSPQGINPELGVIVDAELLAAKTRDAPKPDAELANGELANDELANAEQSDPELRGELAGRRIGSEVARRIGCDTTLRALTELDDGTLIEVGTAARTVSGRLRRTLLRRDQHQCRFPGCGQMLGLHAHHIIHWADGGLSTLDNLITLCGFHHHALHEGGWEIQREPHTQKLTFQIRGEQNAGSPCVTGNPFEAFASVAQRVSRRGLLPQWGGEHPDFAAISQAIMHNERSRERRFRGTVDNGFDEVLAA